MGDAGSSLNPTHLVSAVSVFLYKKAIKALIFYDCTTAYLSTIWNCDRIKMVGSTLPYGGTMLRIISGERRGRVIKTVEGSDTRPTSDKVKESLFNIIRSKLPDSHILDIFSGTGNLGLEALSQGCAEVVFIERDPRALTVLRANCKGLGYMQRSRIIPKDALKALKILGDNRESFDIVFMDPPYGKGHEAPVLVALSSYGLLKRDGIIVVEHLSKDAQPDMIEGLLRYDYRKYGNTSISFYRRED
jgi:16S rRNA (guanine966-N2)-methyltransferase